MLKIGLAGCGRWGRLILRDLKSLGCWVAVAAPGEDSAANAREANADLIVSSIDHLPQVDALVVAVPTILHGEVVLRLAERAVPVFCEKPLTNDLASAQAIVKKAGDSVFVMDKWRYHAGIHALRDIANSGELGPVLGIKTTRLQWGCPHDDVNPAWILLPHDLTIANEILGYIPEPAHAIAESDATGLIGMSASLSGDAWLQCEVGTRSPQYKRMIEVRCRDGVAVLRDSYDQHLAVIRTDDRRAAAPEWQLLPFIENLPLLDELRAFVSYVGGNGVRPKSTAAEGLQVVEALIKLHRLAGVVY